jgi:Fe-S oxidoreductase
VSERQWQQVFAKLDVAVDIVSVGCCGMAGTYGHEASHLANSIGIFELSWEQAIAKYPVEARIVTGYSCRSQVDRLVGAKPKHPLQVLNQLLLQK